MTLECYRRKFLILKSKNSVAQIKDISLGGAQVYTALDVKVGDTLVLLIKSYRMTTATKLTAKVVWVQQAKIRKRDEPINKVGIRFKKLSAEQNDLVKKLAFKQSTGG